MKNTIISHKSIRKYKSDPIPPELLEDILSTGTRASTTGNMQVYSMIVTRNKDDLKLLWEVHFRQNMVLEAPVHITFCADFNRVNTWCRYRKAEPGYDNFLSFFTAAIDALLVAQNVCLAAEEQGLGICYLGTATYNAGRLIEILNLPEGVVPVAAIVMGYPDEDPGITDRLPLEAVVHHEKYRNYSETRIDEIYSLRESSSQTRQLLGINRKETLAQIFTDIRYTKKDNEFFSAKFLDVLKKQGFLKDAKN
jgi:nitroreductase